MLVGRPRLQRSVNIFVWMTRRASNMSHAGYCIHGNGSHRQMRSHMQRERRRVIITKYTCQHAPFILVLHRTITCRIPSNANLLLETSAEISLLNRRDTVPRNHLLWSIRSFFRIELTHTLSYDVHFDYSYIYVLQLPSPLPRNVRTLSIKWLCSLYRLPTYHRYD